MSCVANLPSASNSDVTTYRPFDVIPVELLSHILTLSWLSYEGHDSPGRFLFPSAPSRVSKHFNRTTLSMPILWSYLRVTSTTNLAHIQSRIKERTGSLPLDICIIFKDVLYHNATEILEITVKQPSSRCRTLALLYPQRSILQTPYGRGFWDHLGIFNETDPLQVVHFSINADTTRPLNSLPPTTSSIRSLRLSGPFAILKPGTHIPSSLEVFALLSNVTWLTPVEDIKRSMIGSLCSSLRSLSLAGLSIIQRASVLTEPCVLDSLHVFRLEDFDLKEIAILLTHILTPNLYHLSLKTLDTTYFRDAAPNVWQAPNIWQALQFPNFHKLTLEGFSRRSDELVELIQQLPDSIKSLEIIGDDPIEAFKDPSTDTFCHQIENFTAKCVPLEKLLSLVQWRLAPLQTLTLEFGGELYMPPHLYDDYTGEDQWSTSRSILESSTKEFRIVGDGGLLSEGAEQIC